MSASRRISRRRLNVEASGHGRLVALVGGPADGHWYWAEWYGTQPSDAYYRAGYVRTEEEATNSDRELRKLGDGTVWRFDPSLVPLRTSGCPARKADYGRCGCGERLLLPERGRCERCRLGRPTADVWRYEAMAGHLAEIEATRQEVFRRTVADRLAAVGIATGGSSKSEDEPDVVDPHEITSAPIQQAAEPPPPLTDLWPIIARGYDR